MIYSKNKLIRVDPIESKHGPHFYGLHFFKGDIKKESTDLPRKVSNWKEGKTYAFVVDFLSKTSPSKVIFRIYFSGAPNVFPSGFVPDSILKKKPIDLAIICVASHAYVRKYPEELISHLSPKHFILTHWENFFQSHDKLKERPMVVPFTNVNSFLKKFTNTINGMNSIPTWTLPNIGTKMVFYY